MTQTPMESQLQSSDDATANPVEETVAVPDLTLCALIRFLDGTGGGDPLVTIEEWLTGMCYHAVIGKYPLHIFRFLPQAPESMTSDERHEIALTIAEAFIAEKITATELNKMALVVTSDRALKYYLFAALRNWTHDKIRVAAQSDDMLHLGMRIEKTLRRRPDVYVELSRTENWWNSFWTLAGVSMTRSSPSGAIQAFRDRASGIPKVERLERKPTRYRDRLISTPALSELLRNILIAVGEPLSILELLSVVSEKISLAATAHGEISVDVTSEAVGEPIVNRLPDPTLPDESALIDRIDLPVCAAEFLDSLDELDLHIMKEILAVTFSGDAQSAQDVAETVVRKLSLPRSTYYFRKERLKRRLSAVLSDQDELLFYRELQSQLESAANVPFIPDGKHYET